MLAQVAMFELPSLEFVVLGVPVTQGSKAISAYLGQRVRTRYGTAIVKPRAVLTEQSNMATKTMRSNRLKRWRETIALQAKRKANAERCWVYTLAPVSLRCEFVFARPNSHYVGDDPVRGKLKANAPVLHTSTPDLDKLLRAVGDALTGVLYADDSQVVSYDGSLKRYVSSAAGKPGVRVTVRRLA